ncbi:MAG: thiol-disulfide oxidoreductase domain-containing protein, partial [bacterium]
MLAATTRDRAELVGEIPPNLGRATVEKIAINAVMAGCRPEYLPVVIAAVEAVTDPAFNLHGLAATTHFAAPLIIVNGSIRTRLGLNCAAGVFGPGFRANATIGRALRLGITNLGGAKPGEISMSTFGHPGRYTYCVGEYEEASPWEPLHVERGYPAEQSCVTLFAGEAPHGINDHASRGAPQLVASLGWSMAGIWNHKNFPLYGHTLLVIG